MPQKPLKSMKKNVDASNDLPTKADSIALYNNSKQVQDYYKNKKYSNVGTFFNKQEVNPKYFSNKLDKEFNSFQDSNHRPGTVVPVNNSTHNETITIPENMFRKIIDKNKLYQRENANFILDTRAPMQLYDRRIAPTQSSSFSNEDKNDSMYADYVGIDTYDPILIKPVSMLTPAEKELRIKRYGKNSGLPQQVSKPIQINQKIEDKPSSTPLSLMKKPEVVVQKQNNYDEGESIMLPIPSKLGGGGGAFIGTKKKDGTIEYVKPEDFKRMGVPPYGQEFILNQLAQEKK